MTRNPILHSALALLSLLIPWSALRAGEPALRDLLRDALYTEEVTRDPEQAAKQYEDLLARHDAQKTFAAAALFRLAEVRRKQDRKEDAIKLYQRLIAEYPQAETETKLAKENLATLGGKMPEADIATIDDEEKELKRLQSAAKSAPDVLLDPSNLENAAGYGWPKVVKFLLASGARPSEGTALDEAASRGYLDIVKLLTENPDNVPAEVATAAIQGAIRNKRYTVLDYLLKKGLKPGNVMLEIGEVTMLTYAIVEDSIPSAEILLNHGTDLNAMVATDSDRGFEQAGTALHLAVSFGKIEAVKWLLENGAKPDLPNLHFGITPLHYAAKSKNTGSIDIMKNLLDAGADPNLVSNDREVPDSLAKSILLNATPLETTIASQAMSLEKTKLLLDHKADPNRKNSRVSSMLLLAMELNDPKAVDLIRILAEAGFHMADPKLMERAMTANDLKIIEVLLQHGGDPNSKDVHGNSLLVQVAKAGDAAILSLLVKAGADVHVQSKDGPGALRCAAAKKGESAKILLDAGARPEEEWMNEGFTGARPPMRQALIERFTIPSLANDSGIFLLVDQINGVQTIRSSKPAGDAQAPGLAKWLLDNQSEIRSFPSFENFRYHWAVWRKDDSGGMVKQDIDFDAPQELPVMKWGDVVTCLIELPESYSYSSNNGFPGEFVWQLTRRVSFPITFEIDGRISEFIVRGDRILFDPSKPEVPLTSLQRIIECLWMPTLHSEALPIIHVSRKGWPDIRLSYNSKEAGKFELEAGDRVKLEIPDQVNEYLAKVRRELVTLKVDGFPFVRFFGTPFEEKPLAASIPTLMQALVDTQVPWNSNWMGIGGSQTVNVAEIAAYDVFYHFTLFPHPDLAHIRIRRLLEDGTEKVIEVNLANVIDAASDQMTVEEAKKADVMLQPGDVVEVSLLKDHLGEPWKGFNAQEEAFFAKALSGRVRITDEQGNITVRDLIYQAPHFIKTECGWIPTPPESGIASLRGSGLIPNTRIVVKRGDSLSGEQHAYSVFIRDGDEIQSTSVIRSGQPGVVIPSAPPQPPPPQPRRILVPPPQPSR